MTHHHQRDEVGPDIGDLREKDETCVDDKYKDVRTSGQELRGRDNMVDMNSEDSRSEDVNFEGVTAT